jgi:hypothetical protein
MSASHRLCLRQRPRRRFVDLDFSLPLHDLSTVSVQLAVKALDQSPSFPAVPPAIPFGAGSGAPSAGGGDKIGEGGGDEDSEELGGREEELDEKEEELRKKEAELKKKEDELNKNGTGNSTTPGGGKEVETQSPGESSFGTAAMVLVGVAGVLLVVAGVFMFLYLQTRRKRNRGEVYREQEEEGSTKREMMEEKEEEQSSSSSSSSSTPQYSSDEKSLAESSPSLENVSSHATLLPAPSPPSPPLTLPSNPSASSATPSSPLSCSSSSESGERKGAEGGGEGKGKGRKSPNAGAGMGREGGGVPQLPLDHPFYGLRPAIVEAEGGGGPSYLLLPPHSEGRERVCLGHTPEGPFPQPFIDVTHLTVEEQKELEETVKRDQCLAHLMTGIGMGEPFKRGVVDVRENALVMIEREVGKLGQKERVSVAGSLISWVCNGVRHLVESGTGGTMVLHLCPQNIIFGTDKQVFLCTEDVVRKDVFVGNEEEEKNGWKRWAAPEITKKAVVKGDEKTASFTLGLLLFSLLTGTVPFGGVSHSVAGEELAKGGRPDIKLAMKEDSRGALVVEECWKERANERPNLGQLQAKMENLQKGVEEEESKSEEIKKKKKKKK